MFYQIEVRGGAWADVMNSCFWEFVCHLKDGYILCREISNGKLFAMYAPSYGE